MLDNHFSVDVISARRNADMTIQTLRQCRNEESFNSVCQITSAMGLKIKKWLTNSQFELREARAPRQTPSRRLQALVGEHAQRQTQLTPESYHRINTYYASIDKVLSELELRFRGNDQEILCALGNICNSETPDKESFSRIAKFYNIDGEILEAEQKMNSTLANIEQTSKSNYRPISVLSTIPKVFEKLKFDQLYRHFSPLLLDNMSVFFGVIRVVLPYTN